MKVKKQKNVFILYQYNEFTNDYNNIMEYYTLKELKEKNIDIIQLKNDRSIYQYITNSIDNIKKLLNDKYIIIKEEL